MSTITATRADPPRRTILAAVFTTPWVWCLAVVCFVTARALVNMKVGLHETLGDTDDATRLLLVREYLAGAGWFEPTSLRLGADTPFQSHWSRLIDWALAMLIRVFTPLVGVAQAELVTRVIWPALILLALLVVLAVEVRQRVGRSAIWILLAFSAMSSTGLFQFSPGRIDHHNVMIFGAVAGLVILTRVGYSPGAGWTAGAFLGLSLAVGYEPLALVVLAMAALAFLGLLRPELRAGLASATLAMAVTMTGVFLLTVPPSRYLAIHCDALALNMLVLVWGAALGLLILQRADLGSGLVRTVLAAAAPVAAASVVFGFLEPACLRGPFGQVDPEVIKVWLVNVQEGRPLFDLWSDKPTLVIASCATLSAGLWAAVALVRRDRGSENAALALLMLLSAVLGVWQFKLTTYAVWIAAFILTLWIATWRGSGAMTPLMAQLGGVTLLNQTTALILAMPLLALLDLGPARSTGEEPRQTDRCRNVSSLSVLASLPPGLVMAPVDLGPSIAVLTPHNVVAGPYHRLDAAILATYRTLWGAADEAEQRLAQMGVRYVVLCAPTTAGAAASSKAGLLVTELLNTGGTPFLKELDISRPSSGIRVWQLVGNPLAHRF